MASFGWKRKIGEKVSKSVVQQFEIEDERAEGDGEAGQDEEVDWLHAIKRKKEVLLEDCAAKSKRLTEEGTLLAEEGRWEHPVIVAPYWLLSKHHTDRLLMQIRWWNIVIL